MTTTETPFAHQQLLDLSKRFPASMVKKAPQGKYGSYVPHPLYTQRLLMHLGGYQFTMVEILRGWVPGEAPLPQDKWTDKTSQRRKDGRPELQSAIVGVLMRLTVAIDGQEVVVEDVGDCDDPHNWPHDGARLKDAVSDAIKRCCARVGLGLHLYCKDAGDYRLYEALKAMKGGEDPGDDEDEAPDGLEAGPHEGVERDETATGEEPQGSEKAPGPEAEAGDNAGETQEPPPSGPDEFTERGWEDREAFEKAWTTLRDTNKGLPEGPGTASVIDGTKAMKFTKGTFTPAHYSSWESLLLAVDPATGDWAEGYEPF